MEPFREYAGAIFGPAARSRGESFRLLETWLADLPDGLALDIGRDACRAGEAHRGTVLETTPAAPPSAPSAEGDGQPVRCEAGALPYANGTFSLASCLLTAQVTGDVTGMIREASRVLRPGGALAVIDTLADPEPRIARTVNTIERFRDRRHRWAYSLPDWEVFFHLAGLSIEHSAVIEVRQNLDEWGVSAGMDEIGLLRLRAIVLNGPAAVKSALMPEKRGLSVTITRQEIVLLGRKSS